METARRYEEAESPVEDYKKARQDYETCAALCAQHFAGVTEADAVFRGQQASLHSLLTDSDTIWDQLQSAREGGSTQKKSATAMQGKIDMMKANLTAQDSSLAIVENELEHLARAIIKYQNTIADSRSEHGRIKVAIEARIKSMRKMLRSIEAITAEKKPQSRNTERKSPKSSRTSPPRAASPPKASKRSSGK